MSSQARDAIAEALNAARSNPSQIQLLDLRETPDRKEIELVITLQLENQCASQADYVLFIFMKN